MTDRDAGAPVARQGLPRYRSLDGLRGLAAVAVFIHHCMLVDPRLDAPVENGAGANLGRWRDAVAYTPLHVMWAGTEAVFVFFVLSGFVVALPFTLGTDFWGSRPRPTWATYYPRRIVRLYLPVFAAIAFAACLAETVRRHTSVHHSIWLNGHDVHIGAVELLRNAVLLRGTDGLDGPLWSLRWEVAFSLTLPLYLLVARKFDRVWPVLILVTFAAVFIGYQVQPGLAPFLPMFMIGVVMAMRHDQLVAQLERVTPLAWAGITIAAVLLLLADWTPVGLPRSEPLALVGATMMVLLFLGCPTAKRFATTAPVAFLGRISFSLYLVHDPILVAIADLAHTSDPAVLFVLGAPLSVLAAYLFQRLIEGPSHEAAKAAGRLVNNSLLFTLRGTGTPVRLGQAKSVDARVDI